MGSEAVIMCGRPGELNSGPGNLGKLATAGKLAKGVMERRFETFVINGGRNKIVMDTRCRWLKSILFARMPQQIIYQPVIMPRPVVAPRKCRRPSEVGSDISALIKKAQNMMYFRQRVEFLSNAAKRKDLTPAEQVAIAKSAINMMATPHDKIVILRALINNPFFSKKAKTYIIENVGPMISLSARSFLSDVTNKPAKGDNACFGEQ